MRGNVLSFKRWKIIYLQWSLGYIIYVFIFYIVSFMYVYTGTLFCLIYLASSVKAMKISIIKII